MVVYPGKELGVSYQMIRCPTKLQHWLLVVTSTPMGSEILLYKEVIGNFLIPLIKKNTTELGKKYKQLGLTHPEHILYGNSQHDHN